MFNHNPFSCKSSLDNFNNKVLTNKALLASCGGSFSPPYLANHDNAHLTDIYLTLDARGKLHLVDELIRLSQLDNLPIHLI